MESWNGIRLPYPDDGTYGPEFYLNYGTPDNTTIQVAQLRPMYFRLLAGDTNAVADKGVHTLFDIGQADTGVFSISPGYITGKGLFYVTKSEMKLSSTAVLAEAPRSPSALSHSANATAHLILDSKGTGTVVLALRAGGVAAGGLVATDVNTMYFADKGDNPVLVMNYGATVAARQTNIRGALKVEGVIKAGSDATMAVTVADTGNLGLAPTVTGNAVRGTVNINTGAAPAAGDLVSITIPAGVYATPPTIVASAANFNMGGRTPYAYALSATEMRIGFSGAPAASQAVGTYKVNYPIIG